MLKSQSPAQNQKQNQQIKPIKMHQQMSVQYPAKVVRSSKSEIDVHQPKMIKKNSSNADETILKANLDLGEKVTMKKRKVLLDEIKIIGKNEKAQNQANRLSDAQKQSSDEEQNMRSLSVQGSTTRKKQHHFVFPKQYYFASMPPKILQQIRLSECPQFTEWLKHQKKPEDPVLTALKLEIQSQVSLLQASDFYTLIKYNALFKSQNMNQELQQHIIEQHRNKHIKLLKDLLKFEQLQPGEDEFRSTIVVPIQTLSQLVQKINKNVTDDLVKLDKQCTDQTLLNNPKIDKFQNVKKQVRDFVHRLLKASSFQELDILESEYEKIKLSIQLLHQFELSSKQESPELIAIKQKIQQEIQNLQNNEQYKIVQYKTMYSSKEQILTTLKQHIQEQHRSVYLNILNDILSFEQLQPNDDDFRDTITVPIQTLDQIIAQINKNVTDSEQTLQQLCIEQQKLKNPQIDQFNTLKAKLDHVQQRIIKASSFLELDKLEKDYEQLKLEILKLNDIKLNKAQEDPKLSALKQTIKKQVAQIQKNDSYCQYTYRMLFKTNDVKSELNQHIKQQHRNEYLDLLNNILKFEEMQPDLDDFRDQIIIPIQTLDQLISQMFKNSQDDYQMMNEVYTEQLEKHNPKIDAIQNVKNNELQFAQKLLKAKSFQELDKLEQQNEEYKATQQFEIIDDQQK